jgi:hypothetical protein
LEMLLESASSCSFLWTVMHECMSLNSLEAIVLDEQLTNLTDLTSTWVHELLLSIATGFGVRQNSWRTSEQVSRTGFTNWFANPCSSLGGSWKFLVSKMGNSSLWCHKESISLWRHKEFSILDGWTPLNKIDKVT